MFYMLYTPIDREKNPKNDGTSIEEGDIDFVRYLPKIDRISIFQPSDSYMK